VAVPEKVRPLRLGRNHLKSGKVTNGIVSKYDHNIVGSKSHSQMFHRLSLVLSK